MNEEAGVRSQNKAEDRKLRFAVGRARPSKFESGFSILGLILTPGLRLLTPAGKTLYVYQTRIRRG